VDEESNLQITELQKALHNVQTAKNKQDNEIGMNA